MKSTILLLCFIVFQSIHSKYLLLGLANPYELVKTKYDDIEIRSDTSKAGVRSMNVETDYEPVPANYPSNYNKNIPGTLNT